MELHDGRRRRPWNERGVVRIGISRDSGIRGYVLADVIRRSCELRGATAWVVAPEIGDLRGLNVAAPTDDSGQVHVTVTTAGAVGDGPVQDLATRLLLLAEPPDVPVAVSADALEVARGRLHAWRRRVADWAEAVSAPVARSYVERAFTAIDESWDTAAVVTILDELGSDPAIVAGSRFETAAYLDRILALDLVADVGRRT